MRKQQFNLAELVKNDPVFAAIQGTPKIFTPSQVQAARLKFEVNKMYTTRRYVQQADGCMQYLIDNRNDLPEDQRDALEKGSLKVYPGRIYYTKQLGSGGVTNLIESSDKQLVGIKSFDANALPNESSYVFNKIQILYASLQQPAADLSDVQFSNTPPNADFSNMEFSIQRADIPIFQTVSENLLEAQFNDSRYHLSSLLMFTPKKSIKSTAGYNTGKTFTGNTNYIKVILSGIMVKIQ